jgi:hypothetical protein
MRIGMIAALYVFLPLIYSPSPALAQLNHANQKKLQPLSRMPSSPVNHSQAPKGAESGYTGFRTEIANETLERAEATKFLSFPEEGAGAMEFQSTLGASQCAHILVYKAPNVDSNIVKQAPREFSQMPTLSSLLPCCGDFRGAMALPQVVPFGHRGALGPDLGELPSRVQP